MLTTNEWQGRLREGLSDNARNRKQLELLAQIMEAQMMLGYFNYAEFFPGSSQIAKLEKAGVISGPNTELGGIEPSHKQQTPLFADFADFADLWFLENKIQWRGSHTRNVESILNSSLKPSFKDKCVGEITKADILKARNKMAKRPGRGPSGVMSAKSINNHMNILRMVLTEAADRYELINSFRNIKPLKLQRVHIEPFSLDEVETILQVVREDYRN